MGYSVAVELVAVVDDIHVYCYGREGHLDGYFAFDRASGLLYPCGKSGNRLGTAWVNVDGDEVGPDGDDVEGVWSRFVEAAVGVIRSVRTTGAAPQTAHRHFG